MSLKSDIAMLTKLVMPLEVALPEWAPLPGPQTMALNSKADILFFGGAAGGGKSDLLLGAALTQHMRSIVFRREYPQLKGLEDRSREIVRDCGQYNGTDKIWRLARGRQMEFGAVQNLGDEQRYQGRPHDLKGFDEITHFQESQFRFLAGWLRTTVPGQRCRIICTGNPPVSAEGDWVIKFWGPWLDPQHPNPAAPGELRWYTTIDGEDREVESGEPFLHNGELLVPKSRTFIPARVEDNPYLLDSGYRSTLQSLPEPLRSKMLYGDFSAGREDDPWQVIPTAWVTLAQERWRQRSKPELPMTALGVDVARGGQDSTVLTPRHGNWFGEQKIYPGTSTPDGPSVAGLVISLLSGTPTINVDVIGVGTSVYDNLKQRNLNAVPMNGSERSEATDKTGQLNFRNKRAEWWWKMREALDPHDGDDLALPPDRGLLADLCAPRWKVSAQGIQVEAKEDIIKRIGRSPDKGDSAVYALATVKMPKPAQLIYFNHMNR
jgi:hypothetical protein